MYSDHDKIRTHTPTHIHIHLHKAPFHTNHSTNINIAMGPPWMEPDVIFIIVTSVSYYERLFSGDNPPRAFIGGN